MSDEKSDYTITTVSQGETVIGGTTSTGNAATLEVKKMDDKDVPKGKRVGKIFGDPVVVFE